MQDTLDSNPSGNHENEEERGEGEEERTEGEKAPKKQREYRNDYSFFHCGQQFSFTKRRIKRKRTHLLR